MCGGLWEAHNLLEHLCFTFFNGILSNAINRNCSFIHTAHIWYGMVWCGMVWCGMGWQRQLKMKEKESKVGTAVHTHQRPLQRLLQVARRMKVYPHARRRTRESLDSRHINILEFLSWQRDKCGHENENKTETYKITLKWVRNEKKKKKRRWEGAGG